MSQEQIEALRQQIATLSKGLEAVDLGNPESGNALIGDLSQFSGMQSLVEQAASQAIARERTRTKETGNQLAQKQEELLKLQTSQKDNMDANEVKQLLQEALASQAATMKAEFESNFAPVQQQLSATQTQLARAEVLRTIKVPREYEALVPTSGDVNAMAQAAKDAKALYEKTVREARTKAITDYGIQNDMTPAEYSAHLTSLQTPAPAPQEIKIGEETFDLNSLDVPDAVKELLKAQASLNPEDHGVAPAPQSLPQAQPQSTVAQLGYNQNSQQGAQPQQPAQTQTPMAQNAPQDYGQQAVAGSPANNVNVSKMSPEQYMQAKNTGAIDIRSMVEQAVAKIS